MISATEAKALYFVRDSAQPLVQLGDDYGTLLELTGDGRFERWADARAAERRGLPAQTRKSLPPISCSELEAAIHPDYASVELPEPDAKRTAGESAETFEIRNLEMVNEEKSRIFQRMAHVTASAILPERSGQ